MRSTFNIAVAALASTASAQLQSRTDAPTYTNDLVVPGYKSEDLGHASINAPITDDCYTYLGHTKYTDGKFDVDRCIDDCEAIALEVGGRNTCRFVNTYILLKNGVSQGQICSLYTQTWGKEFATNFGYHEGTDEFTIISSYSYSNEQDPGNAKSCVNDGTQPTATPAPTSTKSATATAYPTTLHTKTSTKKYHSHHTKTAHPTKAPTTTPKPPKYEEPKHHDGPKKDDHDHDHDHDHDGPKKDEPKHDGPKKDEPKHDAPKGYTPKKDEPKKEEPKKTEPKKDEPKKDGSGSHYGGNNNWGGNNNYGGGKPSGY